MTFTTNKRKITNTLKMMARASIDLIFVYFCRIYKELLNQPQSEVHIGMPHALNLTDIIITLFTLRAHSVQWRDPVISLLDEITCRITGKAYIILNGKDGCLINKLLLLGSNSCNCVILKGSVSWNSLFAITAKECWGHLVSLYVVQFVYLMLHPI